MIRKSKKLNLLFTSSNLPDKSNTSQKIKENKYKSFLCNNICNY